MQRLNKWGTLMDCFEVDPTAYKIALSYWNRNRFDDQAQVGFAIQNWIEATRNLPISKYIVEEHGDGGIDYNYRGYTVDLKTRVFSPRYLDSDDNWFLVSIDPIRVLTA